MEQKDESTRPKKQRRKHMEMEYEDGETTRQVAWDGNSEVWYLKRTVCVPIRTHKTARRWAVYAMKKFSLFFVKFRFEREPGSTDQAS